MAWAEKPRHLIYALIIAALDQRDAQPSSRRVERRAGADAAAAHDNNVERRVMLETLHLSGPARNALERRRRYGASTDWRREGRRGRIGYRCEAARQSGAAPRQ